eukprot:jgi/Tetstr1/461543/TSEL_006649.t1
MSSSPPYGRTSGLRVPPTLCERPSLNDSAAGQNTKTAQGWEQAAAGGSLRGAEGIPCLDGIVEDPSNRVPLDGVTPAAEVRYLYSLAGHAARGRRSRRPGSFSYPEGAQLVATSLFNLSFCLAIASWPMRTSGRAWNIFFICGGAAAWSTAVLFLWQKRESTNERFQVFMLQEGFVYSRMIEIYMWTWIGILYCLYVAGLTLATLPLHFDSAVLPGSRGYMSVLSFFLSFPNLLAFDPVSSTKAFKEAAVRKAAVGTRIAWGQGAAEGGIGVDSFRLGHNGQERGNGSNRATANEQEHLLLPGEDQQSRHGLRRALRHTWNPLFTVALGLWNMPQGAVLLVLNVTASVKHLLRTWRWLAATRPQKFLLAVGFIISGLFLWPVMELKITEHLASQLCNGLAFGLTLGVDLAMVLGRLSSADQKMILHAAEEGENVGSGLVFSTAALLNALSSGGSLAAGYVATEERLVDSAAISCRWDTAASWVLTVEQTAGRPPLKCTIMFSREQLHRAALVAWRDSCRYMWIDTLSVPQPSPEDSPQLAARKEALLRRLVPTMTSVYATVRHVFIVETECGLEAGPNCYSGRTWTLQECAMNKRTAVVHLDGNLSILGAPSERTAYTGLDATFNTNTLDDLGSYLWVLSGEERHAARSTTPTQRAAFQGFASTRSAARSADKAVALGQIYFRMLFEHADVATRFMHEVAVLLAEQDGPPLLLIDNTGWEPGSMNGSADPGRVLMGRPGTLDPGNEEEEWWLCKLSMRRTVIAVAIKPGCMDYSGRHLSGHLHQMRTCTEAEKARLESSELEKLTVTWW